MAALLLAPVIALIALLVVLATLPTWLPPETLRREVVSAAHDALHVEVALDSLDYDLAWGVRLRGLRVGPPEGFERDVLRLGGLDLIWALPWDTDGKLVIERAALIEPHVVIETRGGRRNLDALLPPSAPDAPAPPTKAAGGPLSPIEVVLRELAIERATVELVGDGPEVKVSGLSLTASATLDPLQLGAQLTLEADGAPVSLRIPQEDAPPIELSTALKLDVRASVRARADDGLALERTELAIALHAAQVELKGAGPIPPADLGAELSVALDADTLVLDHLRLSLEGRTLLGLAARVDGVVAALMDVIVAPDALVGGLGLVRSALDGRVTLSGSGLTLSLDPLAPFVRPFAPGLRMGGEVRLALEEISGRIPELIAARPTRGGARLELERVRVDYPGFAVGDVGGLLAVRARGNEPVSISGRIDGKRLRAGPSAVRGFRVGVDGTVEAPAYPATGTTAVALTIAVTGVEAPGATLASAEAKVVLRGRDPLDAARSGPDPLRLTTDLTTHDLVLTSSAGRQSVASVTAHLDATLDRLLAPSTSPIHAKLTTAVRGVTTPVARLDELRLTLDASADDPRTMRPIDARADVQLELTRAHTAAATVDRAKLDLHARARGVDPTGAEVLPASATLELSLDVPALALTEPAISTRARIDTQLSFQRAGQELTVTKLRARVADAVDLTLSGKIADALRPEPRLDVAVKMAPLDLAQPLLAQLIGEPFVGKGQVSFEGHARGRWSGVDDLWAKLDAPPLEASLRLGLTGVGAQLPARGLSVDAATGRLEVDLSRARSGTKGELRVAAVAQGPQSARDLALEWSLGLDEGVWRAHAMLDAAQLGDATRSVEAASAEVEIVHPPFGDVMVRRLRVRAPGAGLEATVEGRLARGRFGAVFPDIDAQVSVDFGRLKSVFGAAIPAALAPCVGRLGVEMGAHTPRDTLIEVAGALTLDHFGWSGGGMHLIDASGRIPLSQHIAVVAPNEGLLAGRSGAVSALDDGGRGLQASLTELGDALARRSKFVLEPTDVLLISPRTADYESLRPYYRSRSTARLTIAELAYAHYRLTAVSLDVTYQDGVFRLDRFATQLWDGRLFGEMAFQVAGEDHLRLRLRSTITDLNLDVPVAAAWQREPARGGAAKPYQVAGNLDLRVDLRDRSLNGYFDFTKMGSQALVGLIDGIDPERKSRGLQETRATMDSGMETLALWTGVRLQGTVMTIRNNLLDLDYRLAYDPLELDGLVFAFLGVPIVTRLTVGPLVISRFQSTIQGYSLSNYLEQPWVRSLNEAVFVDAVRGRLVLATDEAVAQGSSP